MTPTQFARLRPKAGPAILHVDIETFPIQAYVWSLWKQNIGLNQIVQDWSMMSFCAEWDHRPEQFYIDSRNRKRPRDERHQLCALWTLLDAADFVVARNGKKFDIRKIKAKFVEHGLKPFSPVKIIDPMLLNREEFAFTSQKLEYTSGLLVPELRKSKHSNFPGFELWRACLEHDPLAWQECEDYNRQDVSAMKAEYHLVKGWYSKHPNLAVYYDPSAVELVHRCGNCGSEDLKKLRRPARTSVGVYEQFVCLECGHHSRGRKLIRNKEERAHITVHS